MSTIMKLAVQYKYGFQTTDTAHAIHQQPARLNKSILSFGPAVRAATLVVSLFLRLSLHVFVSIS